MAKTAANASNKTPVATPVAVVQPKPTTVAVVPGLPAKPSWMVERGESRKGAENLAQFIIPPRMKIVQKMSKREEYGTFNTGDLLAIPGKQIISPVQFSDGRPWVYSCAVLFVPIFFYPEWVGVNPFAAQGVLSSMIRERSTDPNSDVAIKANARYKMQCPEMLQDATGNKLYVTYGQNLNCVLIVQSVNLQNHNLQPDQLAQVEEYITSLRESNSMLLASWRSGGHKYGRAFAALMQKRKDDIFACQFEMQTCFDKGNGKGDFFALAVDNPENPDDIWVKSAESAKQYEDLHDMLAEANRKGVLRAEYDDEPQVETDAVNAPY